MGAWRAVGSGTPRDAGASEGKGGGDQRCAVAGQAGALAQLVEHALGRLELGVEGVAAEDLGAAVAQDVGVGAAAA